MKDTSIFQGIVEFETGYGYGDETAKNKGKIVKTTKVSIKTAFETRYLGPTNTRGGRVKVTAGGRTCTVPWASELGVSANHVAAMREFQRRFKMADSFGDMCGVETSSGFVFMCAESPFRIFEHKEGNQGGCEL